MTKDLIDEIWDGLNAPIDVGGPIQKMVILGFCFVGGIIMGAHLV
tara:strand:- start:275 stop:409 length:135 start_codon:yes stop_codon:yes gene_type:complete